VNFKDPVHWNPVLHEAIWGGHTQLVNDLVLAGSDLNWRDEYGSTPLHVAAFRGLDRVVSTLLLREEVFTNALDNGGATPLMDACGCGHLSVVNTLLAAGADVTIRDDSGFSALDKAACKGHIDDGDTPLHWACYWQKKGLEVTVDLLLRWGADETVVNNDGKTPADL
ncbi:unnamed protein product, partial [Ectocarpus fasciculatus]